MLPWQRHVASAPMHATASTRRLRTFARRATTLIPRVASSPLKAVSGRKSGSTNGSLHRACQHWPNVCQQSTPRRTSGADTSRICPEAVLSPPSPLLRRLRQPSCGRQSSHGFPTQPVSPQPQRRPPRQPVSQHQHHCQHPPQRRVQDFSPRQHRPAPLRVVAWQRVLPRRLGIGQRRWDLCTCMCHTSIQLRWMRIYHDVAAGRTCKPWCRGHCPWNMRRTSTPLVQQAQAPVRPHTQYYTFHTSSSAHHCRNDKQHTATCWIRLTSRPY